jgi:hypothetical protein
MQLLVLLFLRSVQILVQLATSFIKTVVFFLSLVFLGLFSTGLLVFVLRLLQSRVRLFLLVLELLVFGVDVVDLVFEVFELVLK